MSAGDTKRGKKRPKSYYLKCSQQNKRRVTRLEAGTRGFLITCNNREKDAVREAYSILNEYADKLYGPEEVPKDEGIDTAAGAEVSSEEEEEEEDVEVALQKEVKAIKTASSSKERRFQSVNTKAHNCLFIKTTLDDPCHLAHAIFTDLAKTRTQKTRYALRLLPIGGTCKAYLKDLTELADKLLLKEFQTPFGVGLTYSVIYKCRHNTDLVRSRAQSSISQVIKTLNPLHSLNLNNPDVAVVVEVIGNVCCLGTAQDFYKFRRYNLVEVVNQPTDEKYTKQNTNIEKATLEADELCIDEDGKSAMETGKSAMETGTSAMETGKSAMETGKSAMETGKSAMETGKSAMETGKSAMETGKSAMETGKSAMGTGTSAMETGKSAMETGKSAMETDKSAMETGKSAMETGKSAMGTGTSAMETGKSAMETGKSAMETDKSAMETGKSAMETDKSAMETGKSAMETGKSAMETGKSAIETGKSAMKTDCHDVTSADKGEDERSDTKDTGSVNNDCNAESAVKCCNDADYADHSYEENTRPVPEDKTLPGNISDQDGVSTSTGTSPVDVDTGVCAKTMIETDTDIKTSEIQKDQ